jgi:phosphoserine phosphatase RsbU/P
MGEWGARKVASEQFIADITFPDFLDQVQDGLYVVDAERRICFWNRAAEELTGFKAADMIGMQCSGGDALGHRTASGQSLCTADSCPILRCMTTGEGGTMPHLVLMNTASGRPLPISLSVGPLIFADGKPAGAIALFRGVREEFQQQKLAAEIQRRTITSQGFSRNGARVDTLYEPLAEIGGDFLEAFFVDDHTLIATVADATGHGISASLFTMIYKTLLHASLANSREPSDVLSSINRGFPETIDMDGFYIGASVVRWDTATGRGVYAAAGQPHGLVFVGSGTGHRLRETLGVPSPMLGMDEDARFQQQEFSLARGEMLFLCSDGLVEAQRSNGTQFGIAGIESFFSRCLGGVRLLENLLEEVRSAGPSRHLADDVSALLLSPA